MAPRSSSPWYSSIGPPRNFERNRSTRFGCFHGCSRPAIYLLLVIVRVVVGARDRCPLLRFQLRRTISTTSLGCRLIFSILFFLVFPLLYNVPVIHSGCRNLHGLSYSRQSTRCLQGEAVPQNWGEGVLGKGSEVDSQLTVICSLRNSRSSSQSSRLCLALLNLSASRASASSIGYANMTFAPSQMYTSSVAGTSALAYNVSFSSKVVSIGSDSSWCAVSHLVLFLLPPILTAGQLVPSSSSRTGPCPASSEYRVSCLAGQPTSVACSTPSTGTCCLHVNRLSFQISFPMVRSVVFLSN